MALDVIGAGLPRTATKSLQLALRRLLSAPCYHMHEVFERLDHVRVWQAALDGVPPDWNVFLSDYAATVDWPGSAFWRELAAANPDAVVVLSTRDSPESWWRSADRTILDVARRGEQPPELAPWLRLFLDLLRTRLGARWDDPETAMAAYERHNEEVRAAVARDRLVDWRAEDGWAPLCGALGVPIPEEPFPHVNTTAEWIGAAPGDEA
ncbi:MAG: sulfotransferase family protein [Actinomycetota bacterium]|nr:sulfotransferase family protein [Actinomycetota bacterium]